MLQSILCSFNVLLVLCLFLQCSSLGGKHGQPGQVRNYGGGGGGRSSKLLCYLCKGKKQAESLEQRPAEEEEKQIRVFTTDPEQHEEIRVGERKQFINLVFYSSPEMFRVSDVLHNDFKLTSL